MTFRIAGKTFRALLLVFTALFWAMILGDLVYWYFSS